MSSVPGFEEYLISKKIDSGTFKNAEPEMWESWRKEFEQIHPNSFTVQKLNLINPIRRKYLLQTVPETKSPGPPALPSSAPPASKPTRPVIKPKL